MEGRSQHKSQGEGRIEFKGEQFSGLKLQGNRPAAAEKSPFDGLDTTIAGTAKLTNNSEEPFRQKLNALEQAILAVRTKYRPDAANEIVADLAAIYKMAYDAEWSTRQPLSKQFLEELQNKTAAAVRLAASVQIDLLSDKEVITPGGELNATLRVFSPMENIRFQRKTITVPRGYLVTEVVAQPNEQKAGPSRREKGKIDETYRINVAGDAPITQPYWLAKSRKGDLFDWPKDDDQTLPFSPPAIKANITAFVGDIEIPLSQTLEYRFPDPSRGEIRRNIDVVPVVSVQMEKPLMVVPVSGKTQLVNLAMAITSNTGGPVSGKAYLNLSASGWKSYTGGGQPFEIKSIGQKTTLYFTVEIPPGDLANGTHLVVGYVDTPQGSFGSGSRLMSYPHIQTHRIYDPAVTEVAMLDLKVAPVKVGYVMGSGDEVPDAIRQMGAIVTMLEEKELASGDLAKYDTIVVGVRASETRPDLVANNARLLDYARGGGNVVVQYQRFAWTGLAPYPVTINDTQKTAAGSIARVVDENAKVTILQPDSPIFNTPNKITDNDFEEWVQERNAYNLVTFDPQYTPLLESHDAGEQENKGGLVIAKVGKGNWVYCSYSMFRQLPAGVPGAYRLFANMLSMPRGK